MIIIKGEPEYVFYTGSAFVAEWYRDETGRMPAKEYYERLSEGERQRLEDIIVYLADNPAGTRLPKTLYNLEDARHKIYAFKPRDHRFFNFMTIGRKIIILDAYRKHSRRMTRKDLNVLASAVEGKKSYERRVREGVYYERRA